MFSPAKSRTFLIRSLAAAALALACAVAPTSGRAEDPLVLNAIVSLTGSGSFIGHDVSQSLTALEEFVNRTGGIGGRPIKIVIYDDQTNPQTTVQLFNTILAKHPAVVLGPGIAGTCGAVEPLVKDIVSYCFSPAVHPAPGSYMFSTSNESTDQFLATLTYFSLRGLARVATLTATDATGQDADHGIDEVIGKVKNIELVDREHFAPSDISVAAQVSRIKASGAQVLVAWSSGTALGTILRAVADTGLAIPILTSAGNMSPVQLKQYANFIPKELMFPAIVGLTPESVTNRSQRAKIAVFDRELARQGVTLPGFVHQTAWDPTLLIVAALRKYGPNATAAQVHDFIAGQRSWAGINGIYDFSARPQRGLGIDGVVITRWNPTVERWEPLSRGGGVPLALQR